MATSEIVKEAQHGLEEYRNALLAMHQPYDGAVDVRRIRNSLAKHGVVSDSPLVTVPFTTSHLQAVVDLSRTTYPWTDPFTTDRFEDALSICERRQRGEKAYETGYPSNFWSSVLDIAVHIDAVADEAEDAGLINARGHATAKVAHEVTHSALARYTTSWYRKVGKQMVRLKNISGIGQQVDYEILMPFDSVVGDYEPVWIDEAFAEQTSNVVRCEVVPESLPKKGAVLGFSAFELEPREYSPHLLVVNEISPEVPDFAITPAGIGMDILNRKRPQLLPQLQALTLGKATLKQVHDTLRNAVGIELYGEMVERRPYEQWGAILDYITELDSK